MSETDDIIALRDENRDKWLRTIELLDRARQALVAVHRSNHEVMALGYDAQPTINASGRVTDTANECDSAIQELYSACYHELLNDGVDPPVDPEPPIDPEPPVDPPDPPPPSGDEELAEFESTVPRPQHGEIQALIRQGHWRTVDGTHSGSAEFPIKDAWEYLRDKTETGTVVLGIEEDFVQARTCLGNGNSQWDPGMLLGAPINIELVGIGDGPRRIDDIRLGSAYGAENDHVGLYNLDIYGGSGSFVMHPNGLLKSLVQVNCSYNTCRSFSGNQLHSSGMHLNYGVDFFYVRGHRYNGQSSRLKEHLWYIKGIGPSYIVESDLRGGNRTAFQTRAHPEYTYNNGNSTAKATPETYGDMYVADCFAESPGFDHSSNDGGALLSFWSHPKYRIIVARNRITNAKYGCMTVSYQGGGRDYLNEDGRICNRALIADNLFETSPDSVGSARRHALSVSSSDVVRFIGTNVCSSAHRLDLSVDDQTSVGKGSPWCGELEGIDSVQLVHEKYGTAPGSPHANARSQVAP